jgi:putative acetyltransferase
MKYSPKITLHVFQTADQAAVKDLILAGLAEHWGTLDPSKNPDLDDIAASYAAASYATASNAGAVFLVARNQDRIIGTGALVPRQNGVAEVVRMSIAADWRRQGIGRMILQALVDHARQAEFKRIILETTETWQEVIAFYLRFGFRITHYQDGDVYFVLDLIDSPLNPC